jgi:hypothetical protein
MNLADHAIQPRYVAFFETDFMPLIRQEQSEYAAHQPGEIDKKRGRQIDMIERPAKNGDVS